MSGLLGRGVSARRATSLDVQLVSVDVCRQHVAEAATAVAVDDNDDDETGRLLFTNDAH